MSSVVAFFNFFGCFSGFFFVEKYGRRPLALTSLFLVIISLFLIAMAYRISELTTPKATNDSFAVSGSCGEYHYCFDCIQDLNCGFCYNVNADMGGGSACIEDKDIDTSGICRSTSDYYITKCPDAKIQGGWMIFTFLCTYLLCFSAGKSR